jgi:hypothetical protein
MGSRRRRVGALSCCVALVSTALVASAAGTCPVSGPRRRRSHPRVRRTPSSSQPARSMSSAGPARGMSTVSTAAGGCRRPSFPVVVSTLLQPSPWVGRSMSSAGSAGSRTSPRARCGCSTPPRRAGVRLRRCPNLAEGTRPSSSTAGFTCSAAEPTFRPWRPTGSTTRPRTPGRGLRGSRARREAQRPSSSAARSTRYLRLRPVLRPLDARPQPSSARNRRRCRLARLDPRLRRRVAGEGLRSRGRLPTRPRCQPLAAHRPDADGSQLRPQRRVPPQDLRRRGQHRCRLRAFVVRQSDRRDVRSALTLETRRQARYASC